MNRAFFRTFWPVFWSVFALTGGTVLLLRSETAREVAGESLKALFGIVSTPFILESTIAIAFVVALFLFNQWRLNREGDGWVYLVTQEPEEELELSPTDTQRLLGVVMKQKPEPLDEPQTERARIEGYLELGMATEALRQLDASADLPKDAETALLRVRVLASCLETQRAFALLHDVMERFPEARLAIVQTVVETILWFRAHLPASTTALAEWEEEARRLGVAHV